MKTNNLIVLMFSLLFALVGALVYWVKFKGKDYVAETAVRTVDEAKDKLSVKDVILGGLSAGVDVLNNRKSRSNANN